MASTIKVDNVQNQPGTNIINKCGTTITLGASSDTVALASGASQTGFGRTGTVDWITTVKVTGDSPITGVDGKGYFLNTTAGTITVNLPVGAAGSILAFKDYAGTWDTNAVTVTPNGSEKIGGVAGSTTLSTERQSVTLIYIDSTQGWLDIHDSTSDVVGPLYVTATGGSPCSGAIVCTNYKVHTFTGPGTLTVSCGGNSQGSNTVDYLVVGGGGGGGNGYGAGYCGGAGGAGGYRESAGTASGCYTVSPLGACVAALPVSATPYAIAVGGGGPGSSAPGGNAGTIGVNSSFSTITSAGGGAGGGGCRTACGNAGDGASGGGGASGAGYPGPAAGVGGTGNTPPVSPPQGNPGGNTTGAAGNYGGGGGGATGVGGNGSPPGCGGTGGVGATSSITATPTARAGGGGGGGYTNLGAASPCGTGGAGAKTPTSTAAVVGTINTGGGGGGGQSILNCATAGPGAAGGSGVVIIRYKFQ